MSDICESEEQKATRKKYSRAALRVAILAQLTLILYFNINQGWEAGLLTLGICFMGDAIGLAIAGSKPKSGDLNFYD